MLPALYDAECAPCQRVYKDYATNRHDKPIIQPKNGVETVEYAMTVRGIYEKTGHRDGKNEEGGRATKRVEAARIKIQQSEIRIA